MLQNEEYRSEVIDRLVAHVLEKLPHEEAPLVSQFIQQYYLSVSPEDLTSKSILDLYGAVISHWHFLANRKKGEMKVRVYNPQLEQSGWQSTHTVIEIATDDMPFLVDSVSMVLNQMELNIHLIIHIGSVHVKRAADGHVIDKNIDLPGSYETTDAAIYIEIDKQSDPDVLESIANHVRNVLKDVGEVVADWPKMRQKAEEILNKLENNPPPIDKEDLSESIAFIRWLVDDHFTFMGYFEDNFLGTIHKKFSIIPESKLGMLKESKLLRETIILSMLPESARRLVLSQQLLMIGKTDERATVHRPAYTDFIAIKNFDEAGNLKSVWCFVGLFTSVAYNSSPTQIPFLRRKVTNVLKSAGFPPRSHDDRALLNILETLPRDDLLQASVSELLDLATGILHLQERQRIRLFIRRSTFGLFFSCLVYVPRDTYNSSLRERMQKILMEGLNGVQVEFSTRFSESFLARIHFVIRVEPREIVHYDLKALENKLIEAGRTWQDDLRDALVDHCGEERGNELLKRYDNAFPWSYREAFEARIGVVDIEYIETLSDKKPLAMSLYRPLEDTEDTIRFKLFRIGATIPLSDVVPILEKMGLRIISERPYEITPKFGTPVWINDYKMVHAKGQAFDTDAVRIIFQEAFDHIWRGEAENDSFNRLVLDAKLNWREVSIVRAYAKYLWQVGFAFSQNYIEDTLCSNADITALLIQLFKSRFNPDEKGSETETEALKRKIDEALEAVSNLNEDRILRQYFHVIIATLRTNYYQLTEDGMEKSYLAFKVNSAKVPEMPLPIPMYEIFVYSPRVEGIHLRGAKVARGGIRWSDRKEDFRTEILGLMKAQQVKNAVIVPMGAKGGFVVKRLPEHGSREQIMDEVVACYQTLIRGLLDLTDNLKGDEILPPIGVIRYDEDDPYLVVAADKGTATFSDIANSISKEYDFWLKDAFASGGSTGYDHKKMGITAKGAWESVKRHFQELSIDIQSTPFTVVGIGDMAGDVFGNGMLLSRNIKLVAAFNHAHIFLDPTPDPEISFIERERLFKLPRSSWADYNPDCLSSGGGVYARSLKSINISPEVQTLLGINQTKMVPNDLIRAILKAPVDLLWNGGIGTYVKARTETNLAVGDRSNDAVRINGADLRCLVVGEGGNLGFTQLGRVEFAKQGGHINTDAIDNSGGVNCSDNEVNYKILLNDVVDSHDLTEKQRNEILADMQDEVTELVLYNNRAQTESISMNVAQAPENIEMHGRLIKEMERSGNLDRALEFLPDKEEIDARKQAGMGLTRPEVAVLMAYIKNILKKELLGSKIPEDPFISKELEKAFPAILSKRFKPYMERHRLKREIISTRVANSVINEMGISFLLRLKDETGAESSAIIRAYTLAKEVFDARSLKETINELGSTVDASVQLKMIQEVNRLIRRGARWFLRNLQPNYNIDEIIKLYEPNVKHISDILPQLFMDTETDSEMVITTQNLLSYQVPIKLAERIGGISAMFSSLDIVEAALSRKYHVEKVAALYYAVGSRLKLGWFRELIKNHSISNQWEALARATYRDDLDKQQRHITISILHSAQEGEEDIHTLINLWLKRHQQFVSRWEYLISELKNTPDADFTMFSVALRELLDMSHSNNQKYYLDNEPKEKKKQKDTKAIIIQAKKSDSKKAKKNSPREKNEGS